MAGSALQYLRIHHHLIHTETGVIVSDEQKKHLSHLPMQVLLLLVRHAGETLTKQQMLDEVWQGKVVGEEVLTVAISQIRKTLDEPSGSIIKTISGKGYQFIASDFSFEPEPRSSFSVFKFGIAVSVLLLVSLSLWLSPILQTENTPPPLSDAQREQLQKSRFLLTRNTQDDRNEALAILTPLLMHNPQQPQVLKSYLQLNLQMAYTNEKSWQELAEQLIPLITNALDSGPHADLALYLAELEFKGNWDFVAAREAFELAISIEDRNGFARFSYAQFLLTQGEFDKALALTRDYVDLSPEAYSKPFVVWVYNMMQKYDLALTELSSLERFNTDSMNYLVSAQTTYENSGDPELAWSFFKRVLTKRGYSTEEIIELDDLFLQGGLEGIYHWLLHVKQETANIGQYTPPLSFARYAAKSGDQESALQYIEQALEQQQYEVLWLGVDPGYRSLHQNAKFASLLKAYKIPFPNTPSPENL